LRCLEGSVDLAAGPGVEAAEVPGSRRYRSRGEAKQATQPVSLGLRWPEERSNSLQSNPVVAAAMIDRLVHHVEVVNLKGDSYRLKGRAMGRMAPCDEPS